MAKTGISPVSIEISEEEIGNECPGWEFEKIKEKAGKDWENILGKTNILLENGKTFSIIAKNVSENNFYIQSVSLNGKPLERVWLSYSEIAEGGTLEFEIDSVPNYAWGNDTGLLLPSLSR